MRLLALIIMVNIVDVDGNFVENLDDVIQREKRANPADVVGIGVLSTVQNAGLGTYLSTWLPELLNNKCNQHEKLKLCKTMCHWSGCRHNDGEPFNDTCCMNGFKSQCCYKPPATNIQKCVKFGIIDRACNYNPCWLSSPWTALNCFCRPEKKGMNYEYCATECVSRKTPDIYCPWECCVRFFGLHCGCCDEALAKQYKPWPTSEKIYIIEPDPVTNMISSVEKCKTIVEKHCHCRWAMCHKRNGWGASLCCPDGYDLVCCTNESLKIEIGPEDMESDEIIIANFNQLFPATKSMYGDKSCNRTVEKYCPCREASCVERYGDVFAASICCDMGYDQRIDDVHLRCRCRPWGFRHIHLPSTVPFDIWTPALIALSKDCAFLPMLCAPWKLEKTLIRPLIKRLKEKTKEEADQFAPIF
uniref:EGF-like domain-containing protein n=1 Tax=Globodera pallida TaxID=36090 RepID=A0A183CGN5_GLOPA